MYYDRRLRSVASQDSIPVLPPQTYSNNISNNNINRRPSLPHLQTINIPLVISHESQQSSVSAPTSPASSSFIKEEAPTLPAMQSPH